MSYIAWSFAVLTVIAAIVLVALTGWHLFGIAVCHFAVCR